jgi:hypothetical protein
VLLLLPPSMTLNPRFKTKRKGRGWVVGPIQPGEKAEADSRKVRVAICRLHFRIILPKVDMKFSHQAATSTPTYFSNPLLIVLSHWNGKISIDMQSFTTRHDDSKLLRKFLSAGFAKRYECFVSQIGTSHD